MHGNIPSNISKTTNNEYQANDSNKKEMIRDKNRASVSKYC